MKARHGLLPGATQAFTCTSVVIGSRWRTVVACPSLAVVADAALSVALPAATEKFTVFPAWGAPLLSTRAVRGRSRLAPCAMDCRAPMSVMSVEEVMPTIVACAVAGGEYEPGARGLPSP